MAKTTLNNLDSGLIFRSALNTMFTEVYGGIGFNWSSKKMCSYGDSITAQDLYQPTAMTMLGITSHYLRGVGGSRIQDSDYSGEVTEKLTFYVNADGTYNNRPTRFGGSVDEAPAGTTEIYGNMVTQNRIDTIPTDTELLLICGGANDITTLGTLADAEAEDTTFYAAYKLMLTRIHARIPDARVILIGYPFHKTADLVTSLTEGYHLRRNAIKEIGEAYGYPYIDLRMLCGWNTLNADDFLYDNIHLDVAGGVRVGEVVAGFLKTIQPYIA